VNKGASKSIRVSAFDNGGAISGYQWESSSSGADNSWGQVSRATESAYTVTINTPSTIYYRCSVTNACGTTPSDIYAITVHPCTAAPTITPQTKYAYAVQQNAVQVLEVKADGNGGNLSYLWQSSTTGADDSWGDISGTNSATYGIPTTALGTFHYRCIVSNACGPTTSETYAVVVSDCPGYVCTDCAFDYAAKYGSVSGDAAKGKKPETTNSNEGWAPDVPLGDADYIVNDVTLFGEFNPSSAGNLCVYKKDAGSEITWPVAVSACDTTLAGYSDWYLPNLRELRALYNALGGSGSSATGKASDFGTGGAALSGVVAYWSSTEVSAVNATFFAFKSGSRWYWPKSLKYNARCVRRM
jgi:hypothetical protein